MIDLSYPRNQGDCSIGIHNYDPLSLQALFHKYLAAIAIASIVETFDNDHLGSFRALEPGGPFRVESSLGMLAERAPISLLGSLNLPTHRAYLLHLSVSHLFSCATPIPSDHPTHNSTQSIEWNV